MMVNNLNSPAPKVNKAITRTVTTEKRVRHRQHLRALSFSPPPASLFLSRAHTYTWYVSLLYKNTEKKKRTSHYFSSVSIFFPLLFVFTSDLYTLIYRDFYDCFCVFFCSSLFFYVHLLLLSISSFSHCRRYHLLKRRTRRTQEKAEVTKPAGTRVVRWLSILLLLLHILLHHHHHIPVIIIIIIITVITNIVTDNDVLFVSRLSFALLSVFPQ